MKHWTLAEWQQATNSLYVTLDAPRRQAVEACETALVVLQATGLAAGNAIIQDIIMRKLEWAIEANKEMGTESEES